MHQPSAKNAKNLTNPWNLDKLYKILPLLPNDIPRHNVSESASISASDFSEATSSGIAVCRPWRGKPLSRSKSITSPAHALYICYNCSVIPGWRACCSSSLQYPTVAYSPTKSQGCVSRPGHRTGNRRKFNFCFNSSDAPSQFLSCGKGFDSEWQSRFVWIEPVGRHHCKNHAAGICAQKHDSADLHNRVFLTSTCQNASRFVIFQISNFVKRRRKVCRDFFSSRICSLCLTWTCCGDRSIHRFYPRI